MARVSIHQAGPTAPEVEMFHIEPDGWWLSLRLDATLSISLLGYNAEAVATARGIAAALTVAADQLAHTLTSTTPEPVQDPS
jgi:hypothetical protein